MEVSGNVDPWERPDSSFGAGIVLTPGSVLPSFGFVAISENVLWIRALLLAVSNCALLSVVLPSGCSVAQVDVETMVVEVVLVDLQLLSALVPVPVCFLLLDAMGLSFTNFSYLRQACVACVSVMQNLHHVLT